MARRIIIIEDDGETNLGVNPYQGLLDNIGDVNVYFDTCANCNNNPKNNPNASGVCCCALPDLYNKRYGSAPATPTVRYETYTTCTFSNNFNL